MLLISSRISTVLPTPAPPKSPTLPPFTYGASRSIDLDPGLEDLGRSALRLSNVGGSRWIGQRSPSLDRVALVDRLAEHVEDPARASRSPTGTVIGAAGVDHVEAAGQAVGRVHRDRAHAAVAQVLLHLGHEAAPPSPAARSRARCRSRAGPLEKTASMTTPLISTILPTFEDWPFSDNVTPCAAGVGRGIRLREPDRIIQARAPARTSLHAAGATARRLLGPRAAHLVGEARALEGRRHTGGVVEVSDPRRDGGDHRHTRTVARAAAPLREHAVRMRRALHARLAVDPEPRQPCIAERAAQVGALGDHQPRRRLAAARRPTATRRAPPVPRTPRRRRRSPRPGTRSGPGRRARRTGTAATSRRRGRRGAQARGQLRHRADGLVARRARREMRVEPAQVEVGERAVERLRAESPRPLALPCLSAVAAVIVEGGTRACRKRLASSGLGRNTQFQLFTQIGGARLPPPGGARRRRCRRRGA